MLHFFLYKPRSWRSVSFGNSFIFLFLADNLNNLFDCGPHLRTADPNLLPVETGESVREQMAPSDRMTAHTPLQRFPRRSQTENWRSILRCLRCPQLHPLAAHTWWSERDVAQLRVGHVQLQQGRRRLHVSSLFVYSCQRKSRNDFMDVSSPDNKEVQVYLIEAWGSLFTFWK